MKNSMLRIFHLIKKGELKFMINGISKRISSTNKTFGLKRDLNMEFQSPEAQIEVAIRPFKAGDLEHFSMDLQNDGLIEKEIPTCYIATTIAGTPCHRQWVIGSDQNNKIQEFWGNAFPVLEDDEALVESVFTIPMYRRKGIMPATLSKIAKKAQDLGVRSLIMFVATNNIPSLKGCQRSGFEPYLLRTEKWFLFNRMVIFEEVPKEMIEQYSKDVIS
ncbi:GNAT family N-acetyltransferase [Winogradskyella schleiferi]|uniref:GNAT family N-acetyltransferase n=1 Tax=Winogradskyella schleiferi TaxID=2686078 RepID=UPI0015BE4EBD|nr:GNAT family N-acetyltransferase [Winogradskyella schleiferi]